MLANSFTARWVIVVDLVNPANGWWRATELEDGTTLEDCKHSNMPASVSHLPFDRYVAFHEGRGCQIRDLSLTA